MIAHSYGSGLSAHWGSVAFLYGGAAFLLGWLEWKSRRRPDGRGEAFTDLRRGGRGPNIRTAHRMSSRDLRALGSRRVRDQGKQPAAPYSKGTR